MTSEERKFVRDQNVVDIISSLFIILSKYTIIGFIEVSFKVYIEVIDKDSSVLTLTLEFLRVLVYECISRHRRNCRQYQ